MVVGVMLANTNLAIIITRIIFSTLVGELTCSGDKSSLLISGTAGLTSGASHCVPAGTAKIVARLSALLRSSQLDCTLLRSKTECFRTFRAILRIKDFPEGTKTKILGLHISPRLM